MSRWTANIFIKTQIFNKKQRVQSCLKNTDDYFQNERSCHIKILDKIPTKKKCRRMRFLVSQMEQFHYRTCFLQMK